MVWPRPGEAVDRAVKFEQALTDLYTASIRRWHPSLKASVLPSLVASGELPPDPDAAQEQAGDEWTTIAAGMIVAGAGLLWAVAVIEAMEGIGIPLPDFGRDRDDMAPIAADREAIDIVLQFAPEITESFISYALTVINDSTPLSSARNEFLEYQAADADKLPAEIAQRIELAVTRADALAQGAGIGGDVRRSDIRTAVTTTIDPDGDTMASIAKVAGYQAGTIENTAVIAAAGQSEDKLDKFWIATIDGRTRPSHWAADGQRAPLMGTFTVGGEALAFPCDPTASARERKNCRCRMGVLGETEALPEEVDRHTERLDGGDSVQRNRQGTQADEIERRQDDGNVRARDTEDGLGRVASGGWTAPSEMEYDMAKAKIFTAQTMAAEDQPDESTGETFRTFTDAVIALVGEPTSDGRMLSKDIELSMRSFPHPLMWCKQTGYAHEDAYTVGVIESARLEKGKIRGSGYLLNTEEADEAANELAHGVTSPSVDLADAEWRMTDRDGNEVEYDDYMDSIEAGTPIELYTTTISAELIGTTLVATAAFGDTFLTLNAERESRDVPMVASIVAAFQPRTFAAAHFADPELAGPTRTVITEDGRVYGHIACWDSKHRSVGLGNIDPPRSNTKYREFHTSPAVRLDDGREIAVGRLTVGIGHASTAASVTPQAAAAHYDNAEACWALVRVGEDAFGIWFSGVLAPWADEKTIEAGASAPLSGDWRDFGQGYELVAALAVNTPGFNVRGTTGSDGKPLAMVASLSPAVTASGGGIESMTVEDIASAVIKAMNDQQAAAAFAAERDTLLARAAEITQPPTPAEEIAELLEGRA